MIKLGDVKRKYPILLGRPNAIRILLVGCGGTGSFLALHMARLAYHMQEKNNIPIHLTFVDYDVVESKNIGRQNFCVAEIGENKAKILAYRYNAAFGLPIRYYAEEFSETHVFPAGTLVPQIIVGCVDNNHARTDIHKAVIPTNKFTWWLDCGNHVSSGQILFGNSHEIESAINDLGYCESLPLPTVQHPELLELLPEIITSAESCAELAMRDAQSLMVNQMAASHAANYLARLILSRDLDQMATYFSLSSGSARSIYITKE